MSYVYLGGPIRLDGVNNIIQEDVEWRRNITQKYGAKGFFDPTLFEDALRKSADNISMKEINEYDISMMNTCLCGLFNFTYKCSHPSYGSTFEIGYLSALNKPVVIVNAPDDMVHNPMYYNCNFVESLNEGLSIIFDYVGIISMQIRSGNKLEDMVSFN